uniref:Inositol oxygenase n=1 Tax=Bos indicus x Bos taurus TaxID=30522 RepID=A0A4W2FG69_BOBOX
MKVAADPDPSLVSQRDMEPEAAKDKDSFRNYTSGPLLDRVFATYKLMHTWQTVDFVRRKHAQFGGFSYKRMTVMEAVDMLDGLVDESDPDVDFPNSFHAFQTAEGIRKAHPDKDWFHLVGLLHDLGKVLALAGEPQWAVVGDTFPVGCRPQASVVFRDCTFQDNPDLQDPLYRVHVPDDEVQQIRPPTGGLLHHPVPLVLPLAQVRRLPAAVQRTGPGHAALGAGVQVRSQPRSCLGAGFGGLHGPVGSRSRSCLGGRLGGLHGRHPCAAASSTSTPRAPACQTWPR